MSGAEATRLDSPRRVWVGLALGWTALIVTLCLMPARWLGRVGVEEGFFRMPLPSPDKLVHFTLFAGFAALWTRAAWPRRVLGWVLAAGLALAIATELAQSLPVIARDGNLPDTLADTLGVALAAWLTPRFLRAPDDLLPDVRTN